MESVYCVLNTLECPGRVWSSPMKVSVSSGMAESKYRYTVLHCIGHREQLGLLWFLNHNTDKSHMFTHTTAAHVCGGMVAWRRHLVKALGEWMTYRILMVQESRTRKQKRKNPQHLDQESNKQLARLLETHL